MLYGGGAGLHHRGMKLRRYLGFDSGPRRAPPGSRVWGECRGAARAARGNSGGTGGSGGAGGLGGSGGSGGSTVMLTCFNDSVQFPPASKACATAQDCGRYPARGRLLRQPRGRGPRRGRSAGRLDGRAAMRHARALRLHCQTHGRRGRENHRGHDGDSGRLCRGGVLDVRAVKSPASLPDRRPRCSAPPLQMFHDVSS